MDFWISFANFFASAIRLIFHRSDRGMAEAFDAISGELLSWME